jgi:ribosome biogenesis ATPase
MQGLWATHRRARVNLNAPVPAVEEPAPETPEIDPIPNGGTKRKVRAAEGSTTPASKRAKTAIAKDHTPPTARLADLGGIEGCIEKMLELVAMPLCHPEIYLHTGVQAPRGVLLHGPPGCGKTLLANAMAGVRVFYLQKTSV